jgi:organic hydroperoxide reductase OsmC/OhrA
MTGDHRYAASCSWTGSTGAGYESYGRSHLGWVAAREQRLSADPTFRGDPELTNPEQLVVLAASSCQLLSFLAVAARARVDVVDYRDDAEGFMPANVNPMWITRIVLRPHITVRGDVDDERLSHLCEVAHRECFIANSLRSEITVEPTFTRVAS